MAYWLVKSEPDVYSIDDFKRDKRTEWDGVRNYQARNLLREMQKGDEVLFYHSNAKEKGVVGLAKVSRTAFPDPTQFDRKSKYFDPKASKEEPRWFCPELHYLKKFKQPYLLEEMRKNTNLRSMVLLKRGSRLSVQPVSDKEYQAIIKKID